MKLNILLLTASLGLAVSAPAALYTLNYTGSFGPTTTLGGTPLGGTSTPFSLHAMFNSADAVFSFPGIAIYPTTSFSIFLQGHGTYTAAPATALNVLLEDPRILGYYVAGITDSGDTTGFTSFYLGALPAFSADAPTASVLVGLNHNNIDGHLTIALDGGAGNLVVNDLGGGPFTAEIAVVPEPGQWAMMGVTLLGAGGFVVRQRRAKAAAAR